MSFNIARPLATRLARDAELVRGHGGARDLDHGRSETVIATALTARTNGGYSINVHKPAHPYDVIACGDIPRR